jgi:hypothetical protein
MPTSPHVDVAAYVLGILDEPDDAAFSQHFANCPRCRAEFREFSDLPRLLDQVKPNRTARQRSHPPAAPGKQVLARALEEISAERRTRRGHTRWLVAAAATLVVGTGGVVAWQLTGHDPAPSTQAAAPPTSQPAPTTTSTTSTGTDVVAGAKTVSATNPTTGVGATVGLEPENWGTRINLELRGVTGPMQCSLVAVTRSGSTQVVTNWYVPATGFGVPNSPEPLRITGNTGFESQDIERFDIRRDDGGPDLLLVPTA